jgi:hypothetical protein
VVEVSGSLRHRTAQPPAAHFTQNQIWCELVALACDLIAWTQMLALTGPARRREPITAAISRLASLAPG